MEYFPDFSPAKFLAQYTQAVSPAITQTWGDTKSIWGESVQLLRNMKPYRYISKLGKRFPMKTFVKCESMPWYLYMPPVYASQCASSVKIGILIGQMLTNTFPILKSSPRLHCIYQKLHAVSLCKC